MELLKSIALFVCRSVKYWYLILTAIIFVTIEFGKKFFNMDFWKKYKKIKWVLFAFCIFMAMALTYHDLRMEKIALEQTINEKRFNAIVQIKKVLDNIPPKITTQELIEKLKNNSAFCSNLTGRMKRIFGIRTEQWLYIDPEISNFIDTNLTSLYEIGIGIYDFREEKLNEFAEYILQLREMIDSEEKKLIKKINTG